MLAGERGRYLCRADIAELSVPATVQAAIAARIDRLNTSAKRTLNAASVIGARFGAELLAALGLDPVVDELLERRADRSGAVHPERRVRLPPPADPRGGLRIAAEIRSRRVAPAPGRRDPRVRAGVGGGERGADRRTSAGRRRPARGVWLAHARRRVVNPPRCRRCATELGARPKIADALPAEDPNRAGMRIAPRTMLCAIAWRVHMNVAGARFR